LKALTRLMALIAISVLGLQGQTQTASTAPEYENVTLQIVPDKFEYPAGARANVKIIFTNGGMTPFYLVRNVSSCGRWDGYINVQIVDTQERNVKKMGCCTARAISGFDLVKEMKNSELWILLGPLEVYGTAEDFDLPRKKGTYRIKAEFIPPQFDARQKETISQHEMAYLQRRFSAPVVTIKVK
jgi:hypothetical protein